MAKEVVVLEENCTWEFVVLEENCTWKFTYWPLGKCALGYKQVYKVKYYVDNTIERCKNCLVVLGNTQIEGEDFTDTFASVAQMVNV